MSKIITDVIILIITWRKTYHNIRLSRQANLPTSLAAILLRDGSIYFGLLTTINVLGIVFRFTTTFGGFEYFRVSLTSVILSRFFLNLRKASVLPVAVNTTGSSLFDSSSTPGVGSLGGSMAFAEDDDSEEDTEEARYDDGDLLENEEVGDDEAHGAFAGLTPASQGMP
ncbi:hypothetical protein FOMPIDRAFT_91327 [Fomitopsis schrenkii]|uniref:Uncharacterized protein n=1 Tax=Fomitopsis schrenkii TaxID=2126942 RepID=S8F4E3_FOMSC|nr:hypothetical protein FOMPIDRAFT_91327 [Fomitopsis schrenkii]